jgi:hypothetical protein
MERWLNVLFAIFAMGWIAAGIWMAIWYVTRFVMNAPTSLSAP